MFAHYLSSHSHQTGFHFHAPQAKDFGHAFGKLQYHILQILVYVWHDVLHEMHYGKQLDT